jgi:chromosome segregation ATPase
MADGSPGADRREGDAGDKVVGAAPETIGIDGAGPDWGEDPGEVARLRLRLAATQGELEAAEAALATTRAELAAAQGAARADAAEATRSRAEADDLRGELAKAREEAERATAAAAAVRDVAALQEAVAELRQHMDDRLDALLEWVKAAFGEVCAHTAFASPREERAGREKAARQVEAMRQEIAGELRQRARDGRAREELERRRAARD